MGGGEGKHTKENREWVGRGSPKKTKNSLLAMITKSGTSTSAHSNSTVITSLPTPPLRKTNG